MRKNVRIMVASFIGLMVAAALAAPAPGQTKSDRAGFQFLDRLVVLMVRSVAPGGAPVDTGQETVLLAKDLKAAQAAQRVDDLFAVRYSRLLSAVRQAVTMDPEVLFWPMYRFTMMDFVEERTGRLPEWKDILFIVNDHGGAGVGLGLIADAIMSEVVSLHIYLETLGKRPEILKSYLDMGLKAAGPGK